MRRITSAVIGGTLAVLAFPLPAAAAVVEVLANELSYPLHVYTARDGEVNDLRVQGSWPTDSIADLGAPLVAGAGCVLVVTGADCGRVWRLDAHLGDRDDEARIFSISGPAHIWAGAGDDQVLASTNTAGRGPVVYGEAGDDDLGVGGIGGQTVDGGPGNDTVRAGGFEGSSTGIGGPGNDVMVLSFIYSGGGDLDGGPGDDVMTVQPWTAATVHGGSGADRVNVAGAPPTYRSGGAKIHGHEGDDHLSGGPVLDTIEGGGGRDVIDVAGGAADEVSCGDGRDAVVADTSDSVGADCEVVQLLAG